MKILLCLVCVFFLSPRAVKGGNKYQSSPVQIPRITCNYVPTEFYTILAVDFKGELMDGNSLSSILMDTFKEDSAMQCDPYQRTLVDVQFDQIYPSFVQGKSIFLYWTKVLSYGNPNPYRTALEPAPGIFVSSGKYRTGENCEISAILDNNNQVCPPSGCYCPNALISQEETTGVTELMFASSLNENIPFCPRANQLSDGSVVSTTTNGKTCFSEKPSYQTPMSGERNGGKKNGGKRNGGKRNGGKRNGSITNVNDAAGSAACGISAVTELRLVEPCPAQNFFPFTATIATFISQDPCTLCDQTLKRFLDRTIQKYNQAQVAACDFSFRRIESYEIINSCGNTNHQRQRKLATSFEFNWSIQVASSKETTVVSNLGRRLLESQIKHVGDRPFPTNPAPTVFAHDRLRNLALSERPLCLCSAFTDETTNGISNNQFTQLTDDAMKEVTGGAIRVLDQYEVCPTTGRYPFTAHVAIALSVDASTLTNVEISELEQNCVSSYNSYFLTTCPETLPQVQNCTVNFAYKTNENGSSANNRIYAILLGTTGHGGSVFQSMTRRRHRLKDAPRYGNGDWDDDDRRSTRNSRTPSRKPTRTQQRESTAVPSTMPTTAPSTQATTAESLPNWDRCVCQNQGFANEELPTVEKFAGLINASGIVDSAAEIQPQTECGPSQVFCQTIKIVVDGNFSDPQAQSDLEQLIPNVLNALSIENCEKSHFYVYSVELLSTNKVEATSQYEIALDLRFVAHNVADDTNPILFTFNSTCNTGTGSYSRRARGRKLRKQGNSNVHPIKRRLQSQTDSSAPRIPTLHPTYIVEDLPFISTPQTCVDPAASDNPSNCFCVKGTEVTDTLTLDTVNGRLESEINMGAVPGVTRVSIVCF